MKLAVVTGGNRGIGREISRQLMRRGVQVVLGAREEAAARRAAEELRREGGGEGKTRAVGVGEVEGVALDITDESSIDALAERLRREHGGLDILIDNAGISMTGFDGQVARQTIATNFTGTLRVTEALLPLLRAGGRVVMLSSGMANRGTGKIAEALIDPQLERARLVELMEQFVAEVAAGRHRTSGWPSSAYGVSKAGVNALAVVLARELKEAGDPRHILINAVCPGWVRTDLGGPGAPRSVAEGAETAVWAALLPAGGPQGGFFRDRSPASW